MPPSDPEPRTVRVGGRVLSYTDEGPRDAPAVIAVHGLPGSVRDFRHLAPPLTDRVRLLRLDLPGFGGSEPEPRALDSLDGRADTIVAFADAMGLARFAVLGHSMGGGAALVAGERYRDRVLLVVLVSSIALRRHRALGVPAPVYGVLRRALEVPGVSHALMPLVRRSFEALGFPGSTTLTAPSAALTLRAIAAADFARLRRAVASPLPRTLIAHARDDRLVQPEISDELVRAIPGARELVFDEGGHNLQKTRADELAAAIQEELLGGCGGQQ